MSCLKRQMWACLPSLALARKAKPIGWKLHAYGPLRWEWYDSLFFIALCSASAAASQIWGDSTNIKHEYTVHDTCNTGSQSTRLTSTTGTSIQIGAKTFEKPLLPTYSQS